jgi:hypothetical protein
MLLERVPSVLPQGFDGVDANRAAGRKVGCGDRYGDHQRGYPDQRHGIGGCDADELVLHDPSQRESAYHPQDNAYEYDADPASEDQGHDGVRGRSGVE